MWKKIVCVGSLSLVAALLLLPVSAKATTVVYTDQASFLSVLQTPYYLQQNFSGTNNDPPSINESGSGYSYTVSTIFPASNTGGLYFVPGGGLQPYEPNDILKIKFTSANVTAVGGFFMPENEFGGIPQNLSGKNVGGSITFTLSDGTIYTTPVSTSPIFVGFATTNGPAFTSLLIQTVTPDPYNNGNMQQVQYPTMNQLYVGADPVPEPSSLILVGTGLVGIGFYARHRRKK